MTQGEPSRGAISWMARNPIAANLLMVLFIAGGLVFAFRIKQEVFPEFTVDRISVSVIYRGASPAEVEQGIILAMEDVIRGLDGVKEVISVAGEGSASVSVELITGSDSGRVLQDVKNAVDRIQSFPQLAERPLVSLVEARRQVLRVILYGDQEEQVLRSLAEQVREDLLRSPDITLVELEAARPVELAIEIPQTELRAYNLTLDRVAQLVRSTALELPAGAVRTKGGEILLRTKERRDYAIEYEDIPIATTPQGTVVTLGDVATIRDEFEETDQEAFFNGKRALRLQVYRVADETPQAVSEAVHAYLVEARTRLPEGLGLTVWDDQSESYRDRMRLLLKNASYGLMLVLITLGLFVDPKLAFWVTLGIPISVIGAFLLLPLTGASINMISLFAFIVTLGIVVDDAIVVGENIYEKRQQGLPFLPAALEGAKDIAGPVVFAVLTNIMSFMPLFFVPGSSGKFFRQIPSVVVTVFAISLIESLFILPAHLSHRTSDSPFWRVLGVPNRVFERFLEAFTRRIYIPSLRLAARWRYLTISTCVACLILSLGVVGGGYVNVSFMPRIDLDVVTVSATLPFGVPVEATREVKDSLLESLERTVEQNGGTRILRGVYTQIGSHAQSGGPPGGGGIGGGGSHLLSVQAALVPSGERDVGGVAFSNVWRENTPAIVGLESLTFRAQIGIGDGTPIEVELSHDSVPVLEQAAASLAESLGGYAGVTDIDDGFSRGKPQMSFKLKPEARSLGITVSDLASQVRSSFFGSEALRQQRGKNEVRVMVRLPESERASLHTVENLILRTPQGGEIPLAAAATIDQGFSYTEIRRKDGLRTIDVSADVDDEETTAGEVLRHLELRELPALLERYPGLTYALEGERQSQNETLSALGVGFVLALFCIFALLAIAFQSYTQPLIIMTSIPFGLVGAIGGHFVLGFSLSMISFFGFIALTGIVINDSLVLVVTANRIRSELQCSAYEAMVQAGARRLRPILLTTLTTFFGLMPMILETSVQARFLIPMAISIAGGEIFSTVVLLLLVPALYVVLDDLERGVRAVRALADPPELEVGPSQV